MKNPIRLRRAQKGFALVVTLSLMILLTVVAVGLLTLSTVSLRSSGQSSAASIARSNARLAMMLALGELQKSMGLDTSVSAPASSVFSSPSNPHLLGAWQQKTGSPTDWHWNPTTSGAPSYSSKANTFSRWLASTPSPTDSESFDFGSATEPSGDEAVTLVGSRSNPLQDSQNTPTTVVVNKVKVGSTGNKGKFGWAVFDESTKAAIDLGDPANAQTREQEIATRNAPSRFRADALDVKLDSLKDPKNIISLETATVPAGPQNISEFRKRFHDFTTSSLGLLTNTAKGGLKTDLTSLFEPASLPGNAFASPSAITPYPAGFATSSGAPKWAYIRDHYRKYKVMNAATGTPTYSPTKPPTVNADLQPITTGVNTSPDTERLLPVIAKFQLVFSLVTHHAHFPDRVAYLNGTLARTPPLPIPTPRGNTEHASVHLVYDPVITLYNPYDVALNLTKMRIRVWDPPVGFRFTKINGSGDPYFRAGGGYHSLASFQASNERNPTARKCFTLVLTDGTNEAAGSNLVLQPGEVKVFSPRVNSKNGDPNYWNWQWEAQSTAPRAFFDWSQGNNFGNQDYRTRGPAPHTDANILGNLGVEAVPGWQIRAGLQTDHLAYGGRDVPTLYSFEKDSSGNQLKGVVGGWVSMKLGDSVKVEAKPIITGSGLKDFQVDVLAGLKVGDPQLNSADTANSGVGVDRLRSYSFNFNGTDPTPEIGGGAIELQKTIRELLQAPGDNGIAGKQVFAIMEMSARTTKDDFTDSKPWLYNNFVVEGGEQDSTRIGLTHQSYDLRLIPVQSLIGFPDGIDIDPITKRGFFGASSARNEGSSFVSMLHVPLAPAASLGDLIPANLASSSAMPRVVHPFGNSRAHPLILSNRVAQSSTTMLLDHSYLLNDALWDSYYFSTLTDYSNAGIVAENRDLEKVLTGVFNGKTPALNSRLVPVVPTGDAETLADTVAKLSDLDRSRQLAKYVGTKGPFNVNSTSVDAWRSILSANRDRTINGMKTDPSSTSLGTETYSNSNKTPFVRSSNPLNLPWAGYRSLDDGQIEDLAREIVRQIKLRGGQDRAPSLSLSEFVNRRISSSGDLHSLAGILQTAINESGINDEVFQHGNSNSKSLSAASINARRKLGVKTSEVLDGESAEGSPVTVTQGDLMAALAPVATVRGDTFKIRSYGEATNKQGDAVLARAWCEVVVQRVPDFIDPADDPETLLKDLTANANMTFGRRFNIVSFRWLSENEL
jgi:hypothetical protein